jgi:hypothetical protein
VVPDDDSPEKACILHVDSAEEETWAHLDFYDHVFYNPHSYAGMTPIVYLFGSHDAGHL